MFCKYDLSISLIFFLNQLGFISFLKLSPYPNLTSSIFDSCKHLLGHMMAWARYVNHYSRSTWHILIWRRSNIIMIWSRCTLSHARVNTQLP